MTKPITVGLFFGGLFFGAWALVAAVAISSATFSPPEMGADIFSPRSRVAAVPTALRCVPDAAGADRCDQSRPSLGVWDRADVAD